MKHVLDAQWCGWTPTIWLESRDGEREWCVELEIEQSQRECSVRAGAVRTVHDDGHISELSVVPGEVQDFVDTRAEELVSEWSEHTCSDQVCGRWRRHKAAWVMCNYFARVSADGGVV